MQNVKKIFSILLGGLGIMLIFFLLYQVGSWREKSVASSPAKEDFWVITDNHLLAKSLYDEGKAFTTINKTTAGKDLRYDEEVMAALVKKALKEKPQALIFTGDLTLNGEKKSLERLAEILTPLKTAGILVLAIPGNHDIYDGWARAFVGDKQKVIDQISPKDFEKILPDGFNESHSRDKSSLSYTVDFGNYRLFMMDSNIYTVEPSHMAPITGGRFKDETLNWLKEQLEETKTSGKIPLLFMHHNLLPHNARMTKGWVLDNADEVLPLVKKYQVPVAFAGHIHVQDIMANEEESFHEVITSSFSIVETHVGHLTLTPDEIHYQVENFDPTPYFSKKELENPDLKNYPQYIHDFFKADQAKLAYQRFYMQDIYDEKITDPVAELFGEAHVRYFTGNNTLSSEEIAKIKASPAYALAEKYDMAKSLENSFSDPNTPNNRELTIPINQ